MEKRMPKLLRFATRVLRDFFGHNHGLLLTAAVAQNMMLSLIPLSAVLVVVFSHFFDRERLLETITTEIAFIAPGFIPLLTDTLTGFLDSRQLVGWLGGISLLFFSSLAFRVMEDAIFIIFHRPMPSLKRKFWISALMPYFFILIVAVGLMVITAVNAVIDAEGLGLFEILGIEPLMERHVNHIIYLTGFLGLVLLFTLFYKIMPVARVPFRRALAGGLTAAILWELTRHLLVAYYTKVSVVNVLYGSLATIVIVLLTLEAVALILLLGAQVIADLQRSAEAGLAWHEDPGEPS
ncbi:MAG: YihY/virulence factor BrkB family protein [Verrucomicrobiaceae bacterium]|nr:MAG: YihY/virulence factor BrkB family protein [Verrucomicrobiaceae bacterium]